MCFAPDTERYGSIPELSRRILFTTTTATDPCLITKLLTVKKVVLGLIPKVTLTVLEI